MKIDSIKNGVVIDHIAAGKGMKLYELLGLEALECSVALIKNVPSRKLGKKDIIKIDGEFPVNLSAIGYVDPEATVNIIRDGSLSEKRTIGLPERLINVIRCRNPRCITSTEQELEQIFVLGDREKRVYRCIYCESPAQS